MTGRLSAMDDPPCPECETALTTLRATEIREGAWRCFRCGTVFDPPAGHDGNR